MIIPDSIVRSYRRSLCLTIKKDGRFIVHAPMKLSINKINEYIKEKENWIITKQREIENKLSINKSVILYNEFLFLGKKYKLTKIKGIKKVELTDKEILVPEKLDADDVLLFIKRFYINNSKKILCDRLEYFANLMQIDYADLAIFNSKTKWGSCDSNRKIKLNFKLIMLPHKAIDFVLIHELAHVLEFNHSKHFYKIISSVMPGYKLQQKILKEYDYVLNLFK
jgi:predicted metal-dependent hydrolase